MSRAGPLGAGQVANMDLEPDRGPPPWPHPRHPGHNADMSGDPGLFGPSSVTWHLHADPSMWLAGVRALYLQALHPLAMRGVMQNSDFREDPWGRLMRTAAFVGVTTYGPRPDAEAAGARVRRIHRALTLHDPDTGRTHRVD